MSSVHPLIVSVAGVRGIAGDALTPAVVVRYVTAFARMIRRGDVIVGGDSRLSRAWIEPLVCATLMSMGLRVRTADLCATPTIGAFVRHSGAAGGIALTASHNPAPCNGLKFFSRAGIFLDSAEFATFKSHLDQPTMPPKKFLPVEAIPGDEAHRLHRTLVHGVLPRPRGRRIPVVIDCCNGVAVKLAPQIARDYGAEVQLLHEDTARPFQRGAEPIPTNLTALRSLVRESGAAVGFAFDPDGDRLALVDEAGRAIGEERTLVLAADAWYRSTGSRRPLVANLSSSRALDDVAAMHRVALHRTPVGEAHVVAGMKAHRAAIGGEGNGGVIVPAIHPGRDAATAVALILSGLRARGDTLSEWNASIPDYVLLKESAPIAGLSVPEVLSRLRAHFASAVADTQDGLKLLFADSWLHVRPSGTEPIVRLMAEAPTRSAAKSLIAQARKVLP